MHLFTFIQLYLYINLIIYTYFIYLRFILLLPNIYLLLSGGKHPLYRGWKGTGGRRPKFETFI